MTALRWCQNQIYPALRINPTPLIVPAVIIETSYWHRSLCGEMTLLILWQWGGLTRQIISCLDASSSVAVLPWRRIAGLALLHIRQVLEGGHLLPQCGSNPRKKGATSDELRVETAEKHKHIGSAMQLDRSETSEITRVVLQRGSTIYHKLPPLTSRECLRLLRCILYTSLL